MIDIDFLKKPEVVEFIKSNAEADIGKLILNPPLKFQQKIRLIVDQIISRRKAKGKLDELKENYDLIFPPPLSIEQASSKETSEYKKKILRGKELVDLTGGAGIDCLALSKHFERTTYIEKNTDLCRLFVHNQKALNKAIKVLNKDATSFITSFQGKATFFIDPARRDASKNKVFKLEDCVPNILELIFKLRDKAEQILVKLSPLIDLKDTLREIGHVKNVHIVSVKNDCKELLLLIDFNHIGHSKIHAVNLSTGQPAFVFEVEKEKMIPASFDQPLNYLYEPNASILKAGAFKSVAEAFALHKIAPNTHLYTSDKVIESFPGRIFEVLSSHYKRDIPKYAPEQKINVLTRNYPLKAPELKKKYHLKDGGKYFLIGFRDKKNRSTLLVANRINF